MFTWCEPEVRRLRKVHINGKPIQRVKAETPCLLWRIPWFPPDCSKPLRDAHVFIRLPLPPPILRSSFEHEQTFFFPSARYEQLPSFWANLSISAFDKLAFSFFPPFMFICRILNISAKLVALQAREKWEKGVDVWRAGETTDCARPLLSSCRLAWPQWRLLV